MSDEKKMWLTPRANEPEEDTGFVERNGDRGAHCFGSLTDQVKGTPIPPKMWPTPAVNDMGDNKTPAEWDAWTAEMRARHNNGNGHGPSLSVEVQRPTPSSTCSAATGDSPSPSRPSGWPTPRGQDSYERRNWKTVKRINEDGGDLTLPSKVLYMERMGLSAPSASRRSNPMPVPCSPIGSPVSPILGMSETSQRIRYFASAVFSRWWSRAGSRVSPTPTPASDRPASTNATSGMNAPECLGTFDPASRSSRMSPGYLALSLDFFSTEFFQTWPKSGMAVNGKLYRLEDLEVSEHLISAPESGSSAGTSAWMTPNVMDSLPPKSQEALEHELTHRAGRSNPNNLRDQISVVTGQRDWQTPMTQDARIGPDNVGGAAHRAERGSVALADQVLFPSTKKQWLTPSANEDAAGTTKGQMQEMLSHQVRRIFEDSGQPPTASGQPDPENPSTTGNPPESREDIEARQKPRMVPTWPTPRTITGGPESAQRKQELGRTESGGGDLQSKVIETEKSQKSSTGKLSADWVCCLMGLPIGWTQLPYKFVKPKKAKAGES